VKRGRVLKVFGWFPSAHRGPVGADTDATTIVEVYDAATAQVLGMAFLTGPEPPDLGGPPSAGAVYMDLRRLGKPVPLKLAGARMLGRPA
jgi:hypothetical protein